MKRDMDYVREVLLKIESAPATISSSSQLLGPDPSDEEAKKLEYTLEMLIEQAGFVNGKRLGLYSGTVWTSVDLTWSGHEFLETVKDPEIWARTKAGANKAGNFALSFLADLAKAYGKHVAKERLGLDL